MLRMLLAQYMTWSLWRPWIIRNSLIQWGLRWSEGRVERGFRLGVGVRLGIDGGVIYLAIRTAHCATGHKAVETLTNDEQQ